MAPLLFWIVVPVGGYGLAFVVWRYFGRTKKTISQS
jgi:hypothetical protein